jgi:hypothetical protein
MLKKTKLRLGVVAAAAAIAVTFGATAPAYADPSGFRDINGVGSDTTQDVVAGLAAVIPNLGSYEATPVGSTIQTTATGPSFNRPSGSGNGQIALTASILGGTNTWPVSGVGAVNVSGQIDFARSSSGPKASLNGTDLTFIPFAKDAVTYAVSAASDFPRDIPQGSVAQDATVPAPFTLRNIYRSVVTTYVNSNFQTITIRPLLPHTGSGTRDFWVGTAMGLTEGTLGGTVTDLLGTVEEHDGTFVTGPGDIVPFSIAQYIAQGNHGTLPTVITERRGNVVLGKVGSIKPFVPSVGGGIELNGSFPINRLVYNVVSTARLSGTSPADLALKAMFVGTSSSVCSNSATIKKYGFGTIGATCGNTTATQAYRFS